MIPAQSRTTNRCTGPIGAAQPRTEQFRTQDTDEAQAVVAETYLPHRLWVSDAKGVDLNMSRARFGRTTGGVVSYGRAVQLHTEETTEFHVNIILDGRVAASSGRSEPLISAPGQAVVFKVGEPAHLTCSADARQLCLMTPQASVEDELERLLGRSLPAPLQFEQTLRTDVGRLWQPAVQFVVEELNSGSGVLTRPGVSEHLEGLLVDGLLLAHPHNYRELIFRESAPGAAGPISRAAELLEEFPGEPWTVVQLAQQVNLSVRALQYGFKRDFELPPMAYLRRVRLQQAHRRLLAASPNSTTVRAVALGLGLTHLGRFATAYRQMFSESPSDTLARQP